jgi:hypothetical protein
MGARQDPSNASRALSVFLFGGVGKVRKSRPGFRAEYYSANLRDSCQDNLNALLDHCNRSVARLFRRSARSAAAAIRGEITKKLRPTKEQNGSEVTSAADQVTSTADALRRALSHDFSGEHYSLLCKLRFIAGFAC